MHTVSLHSNQMKMELWRGTEAVVIVAISLVVYITNIVLEISLDLSRHNIQQDLIVLCLSESSVGKPGFYSANRVARKKNSYDIYYILINISMYTNYRGHSVLGDWLIQIVKSLNGLLLNYHWSLLLCSLNATSEDFQWLDFLYYDKYHDCVIFFH